MIIDLQRKLTIMYSNPEWQPKIYNSNDHFRQKFMSKDVASILNPSNPGSPIRRVTHRDVQAEPRASDERKRADQAESRQ